jgi:RimJ/RimL family protein N-acetyltransferase
MTVKAVVPESKGMDMKIVSLITLLFFSLTGLISSSAAAVASDKPGVELEAKLTGPESQIGFATYVDRGAWRTLTLKVRNLAPGGTCKLVLEGQTLPFTVDGSGRASLSLDTRRAPCSRRCPPETWSGSSTKASSSSRARWNTRSTKDLSLLLRATEMNNPARDGMMSRTERLHMRCWSPEDAPLVRESLDRSDAHLRPWIPFMKSEPRTLEETGEWLRGRRAWFDRDEHYSYALFSPDESTLIGEAMLLGRAGPDALEVGHWIDVDQGGNGYATEATAAMTRAAFELAGVDRVEIWCAPGNPASAAVPRKLGYEHEATLADRGVNCDGERHDLMVWSLFAKGYPDSVSNDLTLQAFDALGREIAIRT